MNLTRIQEAFVAKIESLQLGIPIVTPNNLPLSESNEYIEIIATETGRVRIQQDLEQWLGAVDCKINRPVSTGMKKLNHYAERITELFSVQSCLTTGNGVTLTVTDARQFPPYNSSKTTCAVNCRISFETFLPVRR